MFSTERRFLDKPRHVSIDLLLKDIKVCSRRLTVVLGAFGEERQILERVYYKGKNQHHGALFWRRVVEIRRYCDRLISMHIDVSVDVLRCSFFSENAHSSPKLARGSWTHFPHTSSVDAVAERLTACSALIMKMHIKLIDIYRSFTLAMQSGAFLQLILTLVAITSRMQALSSQFHEILQATLDATQRLVLVLDSKLSAIPGCIPNIPGTNVVCQSSSSSMVSETPISTPSCPALEPEPIARLAPERIVIKRSKTDLLVKGDDRAGKRGSKNSAQRRKLESSRDEIDEIFGC